MAVLSATTNKICGSLPGVLKIKGIIREYADTCTQNLQHKVSGVIQKHTHQSAQQPISSTEVQ